VPLKTTIVGNIERALTLVLALVGSILLIACANVAHLLLARGAARAHEVATRMALGADGLRIARQSLAESVVLALLGGAFGVAIAVLAVKLVLALYADSLPRAADIDVD
jgi:ABC-type antimicrobial peptide transport system permease subunit